MRVPNIAAALRHPLTMPIYIPGLLFAFSQGILIPVLPLYAKDFSTSYGQVGLVLAGFNIGLLLGDIPAGMFIRRWSSRRVMIVGLALIMLTTLGLVWAQTVPEAFVYRLLAGIGGALFTIPRHTYLTNHTISTNRGRAIASLGGMYRIGSLLGPLVGGTTAKLFGLRAPFVIYAVVILGALVIAIRYIQMDDRPAITDSPPTRARGGHLWATLRTHYRVLAAAGVGQLFAQMLRQGRQVIIPLFANDVIGLDVDAIGLIMSFGALVDVLMFYPAGMIMDRFGRKYAMVPTFALQAVGIALVPFTLSFAGLLFANCWIGFANGLSAGTMMTLGADLAPPGAQGEFLGMWRLIGDVGVSGSPLIVGQVADVLALGPAAWVMAVAGLLAAGVFAFLVPETLDKRSQLAHT